ncbi:MAG: hypothetical protein ACYCQI_10775 [Gammaproteobacteria bacterium]
MFTAQNRIDINSLPYIHKAEEKKLAHGFRQGFQTGWGCQLYALSAVLNWLYDSKAIVAKPLPARKRDEPNAKFSLREIFKKELKHPVPDLMTDLSQMRYLATHHPEISASIITCENQVDYCNMLIAAIDNNLAPIVHFDVDIDTGHPTMAKGDNLHAAVVTGYRFTKEGNLEFSLFHWQKEYNSVSADALFQSTNQLPEFKVSKTTPKFEIFKKKISKQNEGGWYPLDYLQQYESDSIERQLNRYQALDIHSGQGFKNKIMLVDSKHRKSLLISKLKQELEKLKKDPSAAALQIFNFLSELRVALESSSRETLFKLVDSWKHRPSGVKNETNWQLLNKYCLFASAKSRLASPIKIIDEAIEKLPELKKS